MSIRTKLALAAALLASTSAMAADLGYKKPSAVLPIMTYSWTGFYVGADAGYQFGNGNFSIVGIAPAVGTPKPQGASLGVHAGYRYQMANNLVLGAEARAFATLDSRKGSVLGPFPNSGLQETRWGGDARLTLGYAMGRFMPYLAGGLALSEERGCTDLGPGAPCGIAATLSSIRVGWTIGGGVAYAITNSLSVRLDYAFSDFGAKTYSTPAVGLGLTRTTLQTHAVRAGLSYKF